MPKHAHAKQRKSNPIARIFLKILSVACWGTGAFFSLGIFAGIIPMLVIGLVFACLGWLSWHWANKYYGKNGTHASKSKKHASKHPASAVASGIILEESGRARLPAEFIAASHDADMMVVDTETTGLEDSDRIIDIGIILVKDNMITASFSQLVNPHVSLPPFITQLTHITNSMLADAPGIESVLPPLLEEIAVLPILGHNVNFDIRMFNNEAARLGIPGIEPAEILDTLQLDREKFPAAEGHRLEDVMTHLGIFEPEQHRAFSDAFQTLQCYRALTGIASQVPRENPEESESRQRHPQRLTTHHRYFGSDSEGLQRALREQYCKEHGTTPANRRPKGTKIEDYGGAHVSGCYRHQEILSRYGRGTYFWVKVRKGYIASGKYKGYPTIYIDLDGEQIGFLSPQIMSRHYLHIPDGPTVALAHTRDTSDTTKKLEVRVELPEPHQRIDLATYAIKI